jgi:hypothetical protein
VVSERRILRRNVSKKRRKFEKKKEKKEKEEFSRMLRYKKMSLVRILVGDNIIGFRIGK